jgi:biopolymer transport protein ExbD
MPLKQPTTDEAGLNMTPMIDIVFQLILFFMFNMKFKALDHRIDTQIPKDRGIQATATFVDPIPAIKVALFRRDDDKPDRAYTLVKVADKEYPIPRVKFVGTDPFHDEGEHDKRRAAFTKIKDHIARLSAANKELKGEIDAPPPKGGLVPHGDIMGVLDAFLEAGVTEVNFQGAGSPLPRSRQPGAPKPP